MKIGFSNFITLNKRLDTLSNRMTPRIVGQGHGLATMSSAEDPMVKRLRKQKDAFEQLAALPSPKESSLQSASQKVGFLKQRLETLKSMMRFASPEQLKSMAKELKSIARELGVAARQLSGAGGNNVGQTSAPTVTTAQPARSAPSAPQAVSEGASAEAETQDANAQLASIEAEANAEAGDEKSGEPHGHDEPGVSNSEGMDESLLAPPPQERDNRTLRVSGSEDALRGILVEAKKALKEAINELKSRLSDKDEEARRELNKAEESMIKLDRKLAQSTANGLYSSLGQMLATETSNASVALGTIHVEV